MPNIETLKTLVAPFVQLEPSQIGAQTVIDRRAVKGSIMVHRMFAVLEREGFVIPDRKAIATFGELAAIFGREHSAEESVRRAAPVPSPARDNAPPPDILPQVQGLLAVGIDMEEVSSMPGVADFREDPFYRQNFSKREIAYCILQPDPLQSFAGRFCAKEAIVKADRAWRGTPFHQMEILSDATGAPCFEGFAISIAHTPAQAIAIALKVGHPAHGSAQ
jgi:holo-[acyl-carrier protein] synthase